MFRTSDAASRVDRPPPSRRSRPRSRSGPARRPHHLRGLDRSNGIIACITTTASCELDRGARLVATHRRAGTSSRAPASASSAWVAASSNRPTCASSHASVPSSPPRRAMPHHVRGVRRMAEASRNRPSRRSSIASDSRRPGTGSSPAPARAASRTSRAPARSPSASAARRGERAATDARQRRDRFPDARISLDERAIVPGRRTRRPRSPRRTRSPRPRPWRHPRRARGPRRRVGARPRACRGRAERGTAPRGSGTGWRPRARARRGRR